MGEDFASWSSLGLVESRVCAICKFTKRLTEEIVSARERRGHFTPIPKGHKTFGPSATHPFPEPQVTAVTRYGSS